MSMPPDPAPPRADRAPRRIRAARPAGLVLGNPIPEFTFPEELPVSARRSDIADAIVAHQVIILCGETGSGKTTQLPKICLSLGRGLGAGGTGLIGHTQPRRLAASSTARRIAEEIGSPLGEHVGFKVRFHDQLSRGASVKLMTDGILLAETQSDPLLRAYDTLIIDEAHERSLNIDFLLGYLKQILPRRPDLKVIVTSATIDAERFSRHFEFEGKPAPVLEVSGRLFPVELRYRPVQNGERDRDLIDAIVDGVDEVCALGRGDVLVFLPGEREIREAAEALRKHHPPHTEILPLYARLSAAEQDRVFKSSGTRRIVLSTNVAETSLTVPGIRFVVDSGLARVKRYSYRQKVEQLQVEPIAQSSANQRSGRCGRVAAGVCVRLYDEADFVARPAFTDPEILRSSLAAVILRMKALALGPVEEFPFLEAPSSRAIADGYQLLSELGAVDELNALTPIGVGLTRLPLDPRIGRMLLAAHELDCLAEVTIIASALSMQDVRDRPLERQEAADQAHKKFLDEKSEFLGAVRLWRWFEEALTHKKSNRQLRDLCRENFVSQNRLREWRDVHSQLVTTIGEHGWRVNGAEATYEQVHRALLTGLLGNIGLKAEDEPFFLGARGIKFFVWPGSPLGRKPGRWIMAAELIETSRLFSRTNARIEPLWIESVGAHLLKRSHSEPHWEKKAAQVAAFERATLYGLTVYAQRRVDFGRLDPATARRIFIRDGLVATMRASEYEPRAAPVVRMVAHNRQLIAEIEQLEHKARRQDVLIDDELMVALCESVVPASVIDGRTFERWYCEAALNEPDLLFLDKQELMQHQAAGVTTDVFPKAIQFGGIAMALSYHFEPGSARDGVTLTVPLYALNQVDAARTEWLVPGMLKEKVQHLLKSLPQKLRRHVVPLPVFAQEFHDRQQNEEDVVRLPLIDAIVADLRNRKSLHTTATDYKVETVPTHLWMNFKVIDEHGRQLAMGRNLAALRAELGGAAQRQFQDAFTQALARTPASRAVESASTTPQVAAAVGSAPLIVSQEPIVAWTFGELPELMEVMRKGEALIGYPALVDRITSCELDVFDEPLAAATAHRAGLRRLFMLQLKEPLKFLEKNLPELQASGLLFMTLGSMEELREQIVMLTVERACMAEPIPRDAERFKARLNEGRTRLGLLANEIARLAHQILVEFASAQKKLAQIKGPASVQADIQSQLERLIGRRFLLENPYKNLVNVPRYLKAITVRIEKLRNDPVRDARLALEMTPLVTAWLRAIAARKGATDAPLTEFRWLLEELRVALFAQELRTPMPVSVKRLEKIWATQQR